MKLLAFAASHRPESLNAALLDCAIGQMGSADVQKHAYETLELEGFNHAQLAEDGFPAEVERIYELFSQADAFLIASPEYNWSYPGTLKNIIDWMSCYSPNPFEGKCIGLLCATPSENSGLIGLQHLKNTLGGWLGAYVYPVSYGLGLADKRMADGQITDTAKQERLEQVMQGFAQYCAKHHS